MENLTLFIIPGGFDFSKAESCPSKYSWYSVALCIPWHQMITGIPFGIMKLGLAQMVGLERVSGRESEAGVAKFFTTLIFTHAGLKPFQQTTSPAFSFPCCQVDM